MDLRVPLLRAPIRCHITAVARDGWTGRPHARERLDEFVIGELESPGIENARGLSFA
jgi:hypothetical protein